MATQISNNSGLTMKRLILALAMMTATTVHAETMLSANATKCSLATSVLNTPINQIPETLIRDFSEMSGLMRGYVAGVTTAGNLPYIETLTATLLICEKSPDLHFKAAVAGAMAVVTGAAGD